MASQKVHHAYLLKADTGYFAELIKISLFLILY